MQMNEGLPNCTNAAPALVLPKRDSDTPLMATASATRPFSLSASHSLLSVPEVPATGAANSTTCNGLGAPQLCGSTDDAAVKVDGKLRGNPGSVSCQQAQASPALAAVSSPALAAGREGAGGSEGAVSLLHSTSTPNGQRHGVTVGNRSTDECTSGMKPSNAKRGPGCELATERPSKMPSRVTAGLDTKAGEATPVPALDGCELDVAVAQARDALSQAAAVASCRAPGASALFARITRTYAELLSYQELRFKQQQQQQQLRKDEAMPDRRSGSPGLAGTPTASNPVSPIHSCDADEPTGAAHKAAPALECPKQGQTGGEAIDSPMAIHERVLVEAQSQLAAQALLVQALAAAQVLAGAASTSDPHSQLAGLAGALADVRLKVHVPASAAPPSQEAQAAACAAVDAADAALSGLCEPAAAKPQAAPASAHAPKQAATAVPAAVPAADVAAADPVVVIARTVGVLQKLSACVVHVSNTSEAEPLPLVVEGSLGIVAASLRDALPACSVQQHAMLLSRFVSLAALTGSCCHAALTKDNGIKQQVEVQGARQQREAPSCRSSPAASMAAAATAAAAAPSGGVSIAASKADGSAAMMAANALSSKVQRHGSKGVAVDATQSCRMRTIQALQASSVCKSGATTKCSGGGRAAADVTDCAASPPLRTRAAPPAAAVNNRTGSNCGGDGSSSSRLQHWSTSLQKPLAADALGGASLNGCAAVTLGGRAPSNVPRSGGVATTLQLQAKPSSEPHMSHHLNQLVAAAGVVGMGMAPALAPAPAPARAAAPAPSPPAVAAAPARTTAQVSAAPTPARTTAQVSAATTVAAAQSQAAAASSRQLLQAAATSATSAPAAGSGMQQVLVHTSAGPVMMLAPAGSIATTQTAVMTADGQLFYLPTAAAQAPAPAVAYQAVAPVAAVEVKVAAPASAPAPAVAAAIAPAAAGASGEAQACVLMVNGQQVTVMLTPSEQLDLTRHIASGGSLGLTF